MKIATPAAIRAEHDELHADLAAATRAGGKTGDAAKAVATLMHPHFLKEEEFALPPLGLLAELAAGRMSPDMRDVLVATDRLQAELTTMLEEHKRIVAALHELVSAATLEDQPEVAAFARRLVHHANLEEEVMYPAALLVGAYVRSRIAAREP